MSRTRGHKNCTRSKCGLCTRKKLNELKQRKLTGDKKNGKA